MSSIVTFFSPVWEIITGTYNEMGSLTQWLFFIWGILFFVFWFFGNVILAIGSAMPNLENASCSTSSNPPFMSFRESFWISFFSCIFISICSFTIYLSQAPIVINDGDEKVTITLDSSKWDCRRRRPKNFFIKIQQKLI